MVGSVIFVVPSNTAIDKAESTEKEKFKILVKVDRKGSSCKIMGSFFVIVGQGFHLIGISCDGTGSV